MCFALFGGASVRAEEPAAFPEEAPIKVKTLDELEQLRQRSSADRWGRTGAGKTASSAKSADAAAKKTDEDASDFGPAPEPTVPATPDNPPVKVKSLDDLEQSRMRSSAQRWGGPTAKSSASGAKAITVASDVDSGAQPEKAARVAIGETFSEPPLPYGIEARPAKSAAKPNKTSTAAAPAVVAIPATAAPVKTPAATPRAATTRTVTPAVAAPRAGAKSNGVQRVAQLEIKGAQPKLPAPGVAPAPLPMPPDTVPTEPAPSPAQAEPERITSPQQLKNVSSILPYADYEPDPVLAKTDPCRNQCPRPGACPPGDAQLCPEELWQGGPYLPRMFEGSLFTWTASNLFHNPLYFEDVQLERYGHSYCCVVQPFVSVGRASAQLVLLPYQMGIDPPCKRDYALGYYRPGDCAPKLCYQPPLSLRGALLEGAAVTGLVFLLP